MNAECVAEHTVSDADFGYWDPAWGPPTYQTFRCGEPAVSAIVVVSEHGIEEIPLCAEHLGTEPCTMLRGDRPCGAPSVTSTESQGETCYFCADCAKWGL